MVREFRSTDLASAGVDGEKAEDETLYETLGNDDGVSEMSQCRHISIRWIRIGFTGDRSPDGG